MKEVWFVGAACRDMGAFMERDIENSREPTSPAAGALMTPQSRPPKELPIQGPKSHFPV